MTLADALVRHASRTPNKTAYVFLQDGESEEVVLTFQELERRVAAVAKALWEIEAHGKNILLLYPPGLDFVVGFLGCIWAGATAVPVYPPTRLRHLGRLQATVSDCGGKHALTISSYRPVIEDLLRSAPECDRLSFVCTENLDTTSETSPPFNVDDNSIALLQYTSGSTAQPKGVMVSHANLVHNQRMIQRAFGHDADSLMMGWLPMYHDMGLIGVVLQPLFVGFPSVLMSPSHFLQRPLRWLTAVSRYGATTSGAPDFAYRLCVDRISKREAESLDLSRWKVAFNGAEPIRRETLESFASHFRMAGFQRQAFFPCYGLAEATLFVTGGPPENEPETVTVDAASLQSKKFVTANGEPLPRRSLVSSGRVAEGSSVVIVDADGQPCKDGEIGEIWISGPHVARGYWNQPEQTRHSFHALLDGDERSQYLRTGDLGVIWNEGLYVTGRISDLIIAHGRNHYPQDIEATVESAHAGLQLAGGAAFSVEDGGEERLVIVHELQRQFVHTSEAHDEIIRAIRDRIGREHELRAHSIVLIRPGSLPRTTSGKPQRRRCRQQFLDSELAVVAIDSLATSATRRASSPYEVPETPREVALASIFGELLGVDAVGRNDSFLELGGNSLLAAQLVARIQESFGVDVQIEDVFDRPTVSSLSAHLRDLPQNSLDGSVASSGALPYRQSLNAFEDHEESELGYPLSLIQQRLWFLHELHPHLVAYNLSFGLGVTGPFSFHAFTAALRALQRRHAALRAIFPTRNGEPAQVIRHDASLTPRIVDLQTLPDGERSAIASQLGRELARRPIDLQQGPLFDVTVLCQSPTSHILVFVLHHLVGDGWSIHVLVRELFQIYESYIRNAEATQLPRALPYAQYARWQKSALSKPALETSLAYWRKHLGQRGETLELPSDRPHSSTPPFDGERVPLTISSRSLAAIEQLAREENCTIFVVLLAALKVLLAKYTGGENVVVGTPSAGRDMAGVENTIGPMVNNLVLCSTVAGRPSFREFVRRCRTVVRDALRHQHVPFEQLVQEFEPQRDPLRNPLFQVLFAFHNFPELPTCSTGLAIQPIEIHPGKAQFDLAIHVRPAANGVSGFAEFHTGLFHRRRIERLAEHFESVAAALANHPDARIDDIQFLSAAEIEEQRAWNSTRVDYGAVRCLHEVIESRAKEVPQRIAVSYEDSVLSYGRLDQLANQLGHRLQQCGVGPEAVVGVFLDRSLEMVVSLLGILKAGGAYLPLDPAYPRERLAFMLRDAGVRVVITTQHLRSWLPGFDGEVIDWSQQREMILAESPAPVKSHVSGENAAYVIYTSGSTGQPKAVVSTHRGIFNRLMWMQAAYGLDEQDVVVQKTPANFDVSVWEFFWPLWMGARLVMARPGGHQDTSYLTQLLQQERVTTLHFVPSLLQALLAENKLSACPAIQRVICSGEVLPWNVQSRFYEQSAAELHNLYGPTEASVDVTAWSCPRHSDLGLVPIGYPIANTQIYLLDQQLRPLPVGVSGELYIGGVNLARGYHGRPDLTAARFLPNPYGPAGSRLYHSGDNARYLTDGSIQFLGRVDQQVKIRGFRIELEEVESTLTQQPQVQEAAVVPRSDAAGNQRLVAYLVPRGSQRPTVDELRTGLLQRLPEYMVPATFVILESLPRTASGKLNRQALPPVEHSNLELGSTYLPPQTPLEKLLADTWAEILQLPQVGIHDNYFNLGGDSILSIRLRARLRDQNLDINLRDLFDYPTIRQLAPRVVSAESTAHESSGPAEPFGLVKTQDRANLPPQIEDAYPLSGLQGGMIFHSEFNSGSAFYQVVFSFHFRAAFVEAAFRRALEQTVARHPILRTTFDWTNFTQPLQFVNPTAPTPLSVTDLRGFSRQHQEQVLDDWFQSAQYERFEWSQAPLLRISVHRWSDEEFRLGVCFHDSILDGWSAATMISELLQRYLKILSAGKEDEVAPLKVGYRDFVGLELAARQSTEARDFWKRQLDGVSFNSLPRLPETARKQEVAQSRDWFVKIDGELLADIHRLAKDTDVPIKTILLAAHLRVVSYLTQQTDVVCGLVCNGRPEVHDGDRILGNFLNTAPFRLRFDGGTWRELLRQVFDREREILPYRRYPQLQCQKDNGDRPLFETAFNFLHFHVYRQLEPYRDQLTYLGGRFTDPFHYTLTPNFRVNPDGSEILMVLNYNDGELCESQICTTANLFIRALEEMTRAPDDRYASAPLLSNEEQRQIISGSHGTRVDYGAVRCLHEVIESRAKEVPQRIAVSYEDSVLSYGRLDQLANQLGHRLQQCGVGPEAVVGVFLDRSLEMVVSLLGILKAGGAYLPLDPAYPRERLAFMLRDAGVRVVITTQHLRSWLPGFDGEVIDWSQQREMILAESPAPVKSHVSGENAAYVIYTSGSTGQPKAVVSTHRGIFNRLMWMQAAYGLDEQDVVVQKTPANFDVSVWEFFWPLWMGARLVMARPGGHQDTSYLTQLLQQERVTTLHFVPSLLQALLAENKLSACPAIQRVICSGEVLPWNVQSRFYEQSAAELHNLYGPTEASVDVTAWSCPRHSDLGLVPIGYPIANTQIYLLDQQLRPLPVGVSGELYIGGVNLARGYHGRPDLTAARFLPNPYGPAGSRLYHSGDNARYLTDGSIQFLGRVDQQVKIRGFRIELEEVESTLTQQPQVQEAAVVPRSDAAGNQRLVAYLVPRGSQRPTVDELRTGLLQRLPEYMVPATFVILESLPRTASGKLNRQALPPVEHSNLELGSTYQPPQTPLEKLLADTWAEILQLPQVGIHDNYFNLGGDSILSIQVCARLGKKGVTVTAAQIFQYPTIHQLASVVKGSEAQAHVSTSPVGPAPLTPYLFRFFQQQFPAPQHDNMAVLLDVRVKLRPDVLEQSLHHVLKNHPVLCSRFEKADQGWIHTIDDQVPPDLFQTFDLSKFSTLEQASFVERTAGALQRTLNLGQGLLLRCAYFDRGENQDQLFFAIHHAVVDSFSWSIILENLWQTYRTIDGRGTPSAEFTSRSWREWAVSLDEYSRSEQLRQEADTWKALLPEVPRPLPVDFPNESNWERDARVVECSLDEDATGKLLGPALEPLHLNVNDVLLTALLRCMSGWSQSDGMYVELETHGREEVVAGFDVTRTVGCFTSACPMQLTVAAPAGSLHDDLKSVKEQLRQVPFHGIGFGLLRDVPAPLADLAARPRPQIRFNFLGQLDRLVSRDLPFSLAKDQTIGPLRAPENHRTHLIDIVGSVVDNCFRAAWTYSPTIHKRSTIEDLAQRFVEVLQQLIEQACLKSRVDFTPSDFPSSHLNQNQLDKLLAQIGRVY